MNNQMIYELVNAGCDLRKLSPEFLEKLCSIYESAPATATPAVRKPTKAEAIEALQEVMIGNEPSSSVKLVITSLMDDIDHGYNMKDWRITAKLSDLSKMSLNGLPRALKLVRESLS